MKNTIDELAIFGGKPTFAEPLYVGRPNVGNKERLLQRIGDVIDRRWFTNNGPCVEEFERKIAKLVGVKHCIAVCNATIGLELAIRGLDLKSEVIVTPFTFIATVHALQWQGITPVFCDIEPNSCTIDPEKIESLITRNTTGIMGVHLWGNTCHIDRLAEIAEKHRLPLLFDAAHSFMCSYKGRMIGGFGNAEVFSFHATKFFNTFEGGAIVTNDDELQKKIRLMKNFGFSGYDNVIYIGTNGKMSEVSAAMGLTGLESLQEFIDVNFRNYKAYQEGLRNIYGLELLHFPETEKRNYHYVIAIIDEEKTKISRDRILGILHAENVIARRYFYPGCHQMEPYRSSIPQAYIHLPETEKMSKRVLALPTGTAVTLEDIAKICRLIKFAVEHQNGIEKRMIEIK
jgi:dTDP-4-amino-4,6-dideoxygalactose transaminase